MATTKPLSFWSTLALVVGGQIGAAIYIMPATLAPLGANALIGWAVSGAGAMCLAFVFARLGAAMPLAGGVYPFARAAFGQGIGFAVAWSYWVLTWSGNAAVAVAVVTSLSQPFPALAAGPLPAGVAIAIVWLLVLVNVRSVALAGWVQVATTVLKIIPLAGTILFAGWLLARHGSGAIVPNRHVPLGAGAIAGAAATTFWGFLGVEAATIPADKVADPTRSIARATLLGTALTGLLYLLVTAAIAYLMPRTVAAQSASPLSAFLGGTFGPGIAAAVALFAAISAFGALNGFVLIQGQMPWAMARGGVFPAWFAAETPHGTPLRAHLVSGVLVTAITLLNYSGRTADLFQDIAMIALAAGMLTYLLSAAAALRLLPRDRPLAVAAVLSILFVIWLTYGLGLWANAWGLGLLALGLPFYFQARTEGPPLHDQIGRD